ESIKEDDKVRAFLDLDSDDKKITDQDLQVITQEFIKTFYHSYDLLVDGLCPVPEMIVLRNQKAPTKKIHVHFPGLITTKKVLKYIAEQVKFQLPLQRQFIDSNYAGLRMILNIKKDDDKSIYYPKFSSFEELMDMFIKTRIRAFEWEIPLIAPLQMKEIVYGSKIALYSGQEDKLSFKVREKMSIHLKKYQKDFTYEVTEDGYKLIRKYPSYCKVCGRKHQSDNAQIGIWAGQIVFRCWRNKNPLVLEQFREMTDEEKAQKKIYLKNKLRKMMRYSKPWFVQTDRYEGERMKGFDKNKSIQVAHCPMDTGKTFQINKLIFE